MRPVGESHPQVFVLCANCELCCLVVRLYPQPLTILLLENMSVFPLLRLYSMELLIFDS